MRIVLDAMGGDYAPEVVVEGGVMAAREYGIEVVLVGPQEAADLDTTFALASGELARAHARMIYMRQDLTEAR